MAKSNQEMSQDKQAQPVNLPISTIQNIAKDLHAAEQTKVQIRAPSQQYPDLTIADAYAIQSAGVDLKLQAGRKIIGHKIGLTSRAMQRASQITEPDYGVLLDDMVYENGQDIPLSDFVLPKVEVELLFHLTRDLKGFDVTIFDVLNATDYITPCIEIIDARCHRIDPETKRPRLVMDTISDNAANAGIVMGGRPIRPMDQDLRWIGALLTRNGVIEETGVAAGVLNHPANGIVWLVRKLAQYDIGLQAGQLVLAGSFTRPVDIRAGDTFYIDYGPYGSISNRFV